MYKVFIDGSAGTTGLRIAQRLGGVDKVEVVTLGGEKRKDIKARTKTACECDITILCLPDVAAKEIVSTLPKDVKVCDTSTAHRTSNGWVYGFPELGRRRSDIKNANRVAIPGCHASGFVALAAPMVENGFIEKTSNLTVFSLTGYTGGGNTMIADYENTARHVFLNAPRTYGLNLHHKHIPEMCSVAKLETAPLFTPIVADFARGMSVHLPLFKAQLSGTHSAGDIINMFKEYYKGEKGIDVHSTGEMPSDGFLPANLRDDSDMLDIYCYENDEQILLVSIFDNLGKGSSGAAMQCMNLMLGLPEYEGLNI